MKSLKDWYYKEKVSLFIKAGVFYSIIGGLALVFNYVVIPLADHLIGKKIDINGLTAPYRPMLLWVGWIFAVLSILTFGLCGVLVVLRIRSRRKKK